MRAAKSPRDHVDDHLAESILACRTHRQAYDLVESLRKTGLPPKRTGRHTNTFTPFVLELLGRRKAGMTHERLVAEMGRVYNARARDAAAAILQAFEVGDLHVERDDRQGVTLYKVGGPS